MFKTIMSLTQKIKRFFLLSVLSAIVASFLGFLGPLIVGFTVDSVIGDKPASLPGPVMRVYESLGGEGALLNDLLVCAALIAACALIAGFFNYLSRVNMAKGAEHLINNLRVKLFSHTQALPFEWHTRNLTGDIIQRCTSDVETVRRFVFQQLIEVLRTIILVAIAVVIMFSINKAMAAVVTAFLPVILLYTILFCIRIAREFLICDEAEGELMVRVQENLTGVRVVRAFGRESFETDRFDEKNIAYTDKWVSLGGTLGLFWGIGDTVSSLQLLCVIVIGAILTAGGPLTFGDLLVFISFTQILIGPVRQLGRVLAEMSKTGVSLRRIREILDAPGETDDPDALTPPMRRDIEFKNVSFAYGDQQVLSDVSFTIKSGTVFGILGATGSGKSTITYLLNRLYDLPGGGGPVGDIPDRSRSGWGIQEGTRPDATRSDGSLRDDTRPDGVLPGSGIPGGGGSITIGGVDISRIRKSYLRRNIGLVLQEPFLFSKTIFENIDIATRGHDLGRIREKARIAEVDDNIMSFAKGYETVVGERGVTLSGGQKQRVAIARTLMMDAPVMVFDDSMSSLDMETDAKIRESLRAHTAGATVILISHRISTLMNADTIMILDGGRVAEIGSHGDLIKKEGGIYRRVYDLQSSCR